MRGRSEEGIALIAVLWMLVLLSIVAAALSLETRSSTRIARNLAGSAAARAAADAGIQRAILDLSNAGAKAFRPDGTVYDWRFGNNTVRISLRDELRKANLNLAAEPILAQLFGSLGVEKGKAQSLADAIADFRDRDNLRRLRGAEAADYRDAGFAWGPKNAPFQTVEELQQVFGMTPELYGLLAPYVSIFSVSEVRDFAGWPRRAYSIHAEVEGPNGAAFVREAIVQVNEADPALILDWRQGAVTDSNPFFGHVARQ
jgi:general secretion pathway protein K